MLRFASCALATLMLGAGSVSAAPDEARLLRFPAIHGDQIVFTYAGDLYTVGASGGTARRLTSHPGFEMFPRFSPHGTQVAFTGQLYTVPAEGGLAEELPLPRGGFASYSPDGKKLVYNRIFREFRTWKRYRGGMCDDLWLYDFATKKTEQ